jgi:hypothetical protein
MFSDNNAYERLDEKNESTQTEEHLSIRPLAEPYDSPAEENPTEEFKDEHEEYLITEEIKEETLLAETIKAEPTIPDSRAANKCIMACSVM